MAANEACGRSDVEGIMSGRTYLDWNATAPLRPEARAAVVAALDELGNPSSVHGEGRAARRLVELARQQVAALVGAEPRDVVFTSGATEANVLALTPAFEPSAAHPGRCKRLLVSAIEHSSVRSGGRFPLDLVEQISVTADGIIDLSALARRLAAIAETPPLVSVMTANNETGVIQPIPEVAAMVHEAGGLLHVDAVQVAGRIKFDINEMRADLLSISAHKLGGPMGVGALVQRAGAPAVVEPHTKGGGQERGARAGTENVAGIAGFGAAAAAARETMAADRPRTRALRDRLEAGLKRGPVVIFGEGAERLPNTSLFAMPGLKAEIALIKLDLAGFAVSSGSACSSGKVAASHVLAAMGVAPELASGAIRVSIGPTNTENEIDSFLEAWRTVVAGLSRDEGGLAA
jgi:cysteine desulfurase